MLLVLQLPSTASRRQLVVVVLLLVLVQLVLVLVVLLLLPPLARAPFLAGSRTARGASTSLSQRSTAPAAARTR